MITVMDDKFPCKQCNQWHLHLCWHNKYDELYSLDDHIKRYKRAGERFKIDYSQEQIVEYFNDQLKLVGIKVANQQGECVICSSHTSFIEVTTDSFVCSHECKYKLLGKEE